MSEITLSPSDALDLVIAILQGHFKAAIEPFECYFRGDTGYRDVRRYH